MIIKSGSEDMLLIFSIHSIPLHAFPIILWPLISNKTWYNSCKINSSSTMKKVEIFPPPICFQNKMYEAQPTRPRGKISMKLLPDAAVASVLVRSSTQTSPPQRRMISLTTTNPKPEPRLEPL